MQKQLVIFRGPKGLALAGGTGGRGPPDFFLKIGFEMGLFQSNFEHIRRKLLHVIHYTNSSFFPCINTSQVIQGREFMTNFIWQLIQGREFTTNCSFYFFFLPLFHLFNMAVVRVHQRTYIMTQHVQYVSVYVQREITLNSGKEISAPQIIQGREFTTREITSFIF